MSSSSVSSVTALRRLCAWLMPLQWRADRTFGAKPVILYGRIDGGAQDSNQLGFIECIRKSRRPYVEMSDLRNAEMLQRGIVSSQTRGPGRASWNRGSAHETTPVHHPARERRGVAARGAFASS